MAEAQAVVGAGAPRRGMLVVLNERPPFVGGQILDLIKERMAAERDRVVKIFNYEFIVNAASVQAELHADEMAAMGIGRGFMATLMSLENRAIGDLQLMLEAGALVLCSGWMRQGPQGERLMTKLLRLAQGTGCLVLWANALAASPQLEDDGEGVSIERAAAIVEDVRWSGDNPYVECSLELIDPHDQQGWDLRGIRVKRFDFHEPDKGDIVDDLFARINYWDLRGPN